MRLTLLVALALLISGCTSSIQEPHKYNSVSFSANIADGLPFWQTTCDEHFHKKCLVFMCHGDSINGTWFCFPDWEGHRPIPITFVIDLLRSQIPREMPIVLIVCNPSGVVLHGFPNTYYARDSVWNIPGNDAKWRMFHWELCVGHISEFIEAK